VANVEPLNTSLFYLALEIDQFYQSNINMEKQASLPAIQRSIWAGRIPLEIILAPAESRTFDQTNPYLV
jgi:hypothetical protein